MARLSLDGVGDVEEACYRDLTSGSRVLLWYSDDNVWHEAMIGLVLGGEEAYIYTPDKDLYRECLGCKGTHGPSKLRGLGPRMTLPRNLRARAYRFRDAISDDDIKRIIRESLALAREELGHEGVPPTEVCNSAGTRMTLEAFFGGPFVQRRLTLGEKDDSPKNAKVVSPALADYVWVAAEPLGGLSLGQEVCLNTDTDVQCGSHHAMAMRRGDWVKVEMIKVVEADGYADRRRRLFNAVAAGSGECPQPAKAGAGAGDDVGATVDEDKEVRTLWVDFDEHGDRYKRWRDVCKESYTPNFEQKPLEGPLTGLHIMKHSERHGGDPRLWLQVWMRTKHIEVTDRSYHEMKVLTDALFYAGTFDQVNIPALMSLEVICRRIQAIVDAYGNPSRPSWENAKIFAGQGTPDDIVSPTFRNYATKKNKEELELLQARQKVRELRGGPSASHEDGDAADALPQKPPGKPAPKRKGGKGGWASRCLRMQSRRPFSLPEVSLRTMLGRRA